MPTNTPQQYRVPAVAMNGWDQEFKSREVALRQKNNLISAFIRSLVLNTLIIFMDASATGRLEWFTAVFSGTD